MYYKKKPIVVFAMQVPPLKEVATEELIEFLIGMKELWESERDGSIIIYSRSGDLIAHPGDWIIRGVEGEYFPCPNSVFEATYELN